MYQNALVVSNKYCRMLESEIFQIEKEVFFVKLAKKESKMLKLKRREYTYFAVTNVI